MSEAIDHIMKQVFFIFLGAHVFREEALPAKRKQQQSWMRIRH
jgi:hypothetical protein